MIRAEVRDLRCLPCRSREWSLGQPDPGGAGKGGKRPSQSRRRNELEYTHLPTDTTTSDEAQQAVETAERLIAAADQLLGQLSFFHMTDAAPMVSGCHRGRQRTYPSSAASSGTWRASAIRLRAQRRDVLPNMAASLRSDSGLPTSILVR